MYIRYTIYTIFFLDHTQESRLYNNIQSYISILNQNKLNIFLMYIKYIFPILYNKTTKMTWVVSYVPSVI